MPETFYNALSDPPRFVIEFDTHHHEFQEKTGESGGDG